ncbi:flavin reductase family protein [Frankia sp. AiPs1]|uniref:flavin reductase family protein n=1 Tax=Frankia sp. AiPs1 TaxID=573493 RepID=UPI002043735D|nr:flavin reductase family protein [Frankia sp. AiPs1]MCM3921337.1 flavin reductase family protein [Frankia sp. AiPs1]
MRRQAAAGSVEGDDCGLDLDQFKDVLAHFPSGVAVVTTRGAARVPYEFTASSFYSVSMNPTLVSVCLARSARGHPVFLGTNEFVVQPSGLAAVGSGEKGSRARPTISSRTTRCSTPSTAHRSSRARWQC